MMRYVKLPLVVLPVLVLVAACDTFPTRTPAASAPVQTAGQNSEAVSSVVEVQALRDELARLRNEIEIQRNEMDMLKRRQRELYDDLDHRLRSRERGGDLAATGSVSYAPSAQQPGLSPNVGGGVQGATGGPATTDLSIPKADGTLAGQVGVQDGSDATGQVAIGGPSSAGGDTAAMAIAQAAVATAEEQAAYDSAFESLKRSRYAESVAAFQQLVRQYPGGALADDAQYWVGEAMYVTRDFQGALRAFGAVVDRYPESQRVAEAMLKRGYIQFETGDRERARQTLTEVINRFPGSRVAISAQTRLRRLQNGGG